MSDAEHDYEALLWAESADLAALMDELDDTDFDRASLCDGWREVVDGRVRKGISRVISTKESFVDHLIHQQDIRRPLERTRTIPDDRVTAALDAMPTIGGFVKSKQRMRGLTWTASDVAWTFGAGPAVTGPAEALILLASGRRAPIDEVSGDGVATLHERLTA